MFTAALFVFMCVVCDLIEGRHLSVYDNCETDYQLTDVNNRPRYNVSITIEDCHSDSYASMTDSHKLHQHSYSGSFSLHVREFDGKRLLSLEWDSPTDSCNLDYFIVITTIFEPRYIYNDNDRKCLHVSLKPIKTGDFRSEVNKLHVNCLLVPLDIVGVMHVHSNRRGRCFHERRKTNDVFNIGCTFSKMEVMVGGECLDIRLQNLPADIDLSKSKIYIDGQNCRNHSCALNSSRYLSQGTRMMILPVHGQGKYTIKVELVCNTNGEIVRHSSTLEKTVTNASTCPKVKVNPTSATQPTSTTEPLDKLKDVVIIPIISILGCVVVVTTTVFVFVYCVYRSRGMQIPRRGQRSNDGISTSLNNERAVSDHEIVPLNSP